MTAGAMSGAGQLEGRTALVTGASQGAGKVIALRFAREGATVVLAARSRERLEETAAEITAAGGTAVVAPTDLRQVAEVEALAERIEAGGGGLDVIVSNSGIAGPTAELWKVEPEEWEETMRVNVTGTFLLCRSLLPAMVRRGSGSVVVIGSATGKRPLYGRTPYAASKMALVGLVRTLAAELGPAGVRVNLLSPGGVAGPRIEHGHPRAGPGHRKLPRSRVRGVHEIHAAKAARAAGGHRLRRPVPGL